ncbi:MAG: transcriptional regulator [Devosia sp.]|nr:transcriptional regulator [Devosia sp.]
MLVFLDFEASSLSKFSYPVEVGWVFEDGLGESHLIRPAPAWTEWDAAAEATHGISRDLLERDGLPVERVCDKVVRLFDDNRVFASAPSWDGHWLSMLLRAAGRPRHLVRLMGTEVAFLEAAHDAAGDAADTIAAARREVEVLPVVHRALADARREREIWLAVRRLSGRA